MTRVESVPFVTSQGLCVFSVHLSLAVSEKCSKQNKFSHILEDRGGFVCRVRDKYYCQRAEEKRISRNADAPCSDGLSKAIY